MHRLGIFETLGTSLKTTNALESIHSRVESRTAKVDHWRNSDQKQRRLATALWILNRGCGEFACSDYGADLSRPQRDLLAAIDGKLATISRDGAQFDAELWTEDLSTSQHWADVRTLATSALEAFGWPVESPPADRSTHQVSGSM